MSEPALGRRHAGAQARGTALHAFDGFGIELEYMIVSADTLDVAPLAEEALRRAAGARTRSPVNECEHDGLGWAHELASHVLELRNCSPGPLERLASRFQAEVRAMNSLLAPLGAMLMPGGMHPWMDPARETVLWPHEDAPIYRSYDRLFGCSAHGWSNVQSVQLNLPFCGDGEFERVHAAVRLVLPLIPAIAASSPFREGRRADARDYRMRAYRGNAQAIPRINGNLIPETIHSSEEYRREVLEPLYREMAPHDPEGLLQHEWLNARGAIARFDRNAIEVRVLDMQECPRMDLALAALVADVVLLACEEAWCPLAEQQAMDTETLAAVFRECERDGEDAVLASPRFLRLFGMGGAQCRAGTLWSRLAETLDARGAPHEPLWADALHLVLAQGTLASRLLRAAGAQPDHRSLRTAYRKLCDCLAAEEPFLP
jgi:carboxylate-amine ligase